MSIASNEQIAAAKKREAIEKEIIKKIAKQEKISLEQAERKYWNLKILNEMRQKEQAEANKSLKSNLLYYSIVIATITILYFLFK
jgi:hypothetical protein